MIEIIVIVIARHALKRGEAISLQIRKDCFALLAMTGIFCGKKLLPMLKTLVAMLKTIAGAYKTIALAAKITAWLFHTIAFAAKTAD